MPFLLKLIEKYGEFAFFFMLQLIALFLIYTRNSYSNYRINNTVTNLKGNIHDKVHDRINYFGLRAENERLSQANAQLRQQLDSLTPSLDPTLFPFSEIVKKDTVKIEEIDSVLQPMNYTITRRKTYDFISAKIIQQTHNRKKNFQILDKGKNDGVRVGQDVITDSGVSGSIVQVSEDYSVAASFLNPITSVWVEKKNGEASGPLKWDGESPYSAVLKGVPERHEVKIGDTLLTSTDSGHPAGIPIGEVTKVDADPSTREKVLSVELFEDFSKVKNVYIVGREKVEQISELRNYINAQ